MKSWGRVVQKPVNTNRGLKANKGFCLKAFPLLILSYSLKAAKVKIYEKRNLQEFTSLSYKTEFKIDTNPGLT